MDIRISPSKLGNRYVLGRAGKDIRNITGSVRIDGFAQGIISKYEKPEETDLPITKMELLKRPQLPEALADIQEIINELLIINRSHTDVENAIFRNISIENSILKINMLLSKLETSSEYKNIRQGLEEIYRIQMTQYPAAEIKEGAQLELPLGVVSEEELIRQIETVLREGGITSSELVERIMGPAEREYRTEQEELIRQPEYIPMNVKPLSRWKSPEAKNFFWRVQRLEKQDRELVLKSLGNISLSRLETVLSEMDSRTWNKYSSSIAENIKLYMESAETQDTKNQSLMAEPVAAVNYYSQLLELIDKEESLTPEVLLQEKENLIRFLEREDTDTERIREELTRILYDIHKESVFTPSIPDKKGAEAPRGEAGEDREKKAPADELIRQQEAEKAEDRTPDTVREEELLRRRVISRVIEDIETMNVAEFSTLYQRIRENAEVPQDVAERLIPTLRVEGTEATDEEIEIDRQTVINFLKKNTVRQGYYSDVLVRDILRADEYRRRSERSATELAETTMNLSIEEWQRFTTELRQLSEKSELSRRYLKAAEEAREAAERAGEDGGIEGAGKTKTLAPEMRAQVESTREKMIFITQLDKAYKEGIDIYEEGDILTENSIFSQYIHRRGPEGVNTGETGRSDMREPAAETEQAARGVRERAVAETVLGELIRENRDIYHEGDTHIENNIFSQYIHRRGSSDEAPEAAEEKQKDSTRLLVAYLTRENIRTLTERINQRIAEREEREEAVRREILLTQREETQKTSQLESVLEERELIHPELRLRRIRSSMEPMLEEIQEAGPSQAAVEQAISYIEKRRDARTGEAVEMAAPPAEAPVQLVTMKRPETASREEIEEIKKTAAETRKQLDENTTDIQFIKGDTQRTEITNEKVVDMKDLREKLTVQENEIEKIKEIQQQLIRAEKSDSYYTQKTITKVNEQLRMERMRRGL